MLHRTLPQGLTTVMGEYTRNWSMLFAGWILSAGPACVVRSEQLMNGITKAR
jgi:raffinose/stachyose/melibiose transport system permease protein